MTMEVRVVYGQTGCEVMFDIGFCIFKRMATGHG
jgi:hypothetical protein